MEDAVYICSWSQSEQGYELWLKSKPKVRGFGSTYDEAEEALIEAIQDSGGAMRAVLEFDPPLRPADNIRDFLKLEIVEVSGDERFEQDEPRPGGEALQEWYDRFYENGICRKCGTPRGPRTELPLDLSYVRSGYGGGFVTIGGLQIGQQGVSEHDIL